jgi:hypothetical protein
MAEVRWRTVYRVELTGGVGPDTIAIRARMAIPSGRFRLIRRFPSSHRDDRREIARESPLIIMAERIDIGHQAEPAPAAK